MKIENYSLPENSMTLDVLYRQIASDVQVEIENLGNEMD